MVFTPIRRQQQHGLQQGDSRNLEGARSSNLKMGVARTSATSNAQLRRSASSVGDLAYNGGKGYGWVHRNWNYVSHSVILLWCVVCRPILDLKCHLVVAGFGTKADARVTPDDDTFSDVCRNIDNFSPKLDFKHVLSLLPCCGDPPQQKSRFRRRRRSPCFRPTLPIPRISAYLLLPLAEVAAWLQILIEPPPQLQQDA